MLVNCSDACHFSPFAPPVWNCLPFDWKHEQKPSLGALHKTAGTFVAWDLRQNGSNFNSQCTAFITSV
jgi:hypothetical protein